MLHSIGNYQVFNAKRNIINRYLFESTLSDFYLRGFAFNNNNGGSGIIGDYNVAAFGHFVYVKGFFNHHS